MSIGRFLFLQIFVLLILIGLQYSMHEGRWQISLSPSDAVIWWELRLPRFLMAFAAGMALALAGFAMQWLVQNPMADPYLLGTSGGASLGHLLFQLFGGAHYVGYLLASFGGSMGASLSALSLSARANQISLFRLLIAGLSISSFCVAISSGLLLWLEGDHAVKSYLIWNFGSLDQARLWSACWVLGMAVLAWLYLQYSYPQLLLLALGWERARNLQVPVRKLRWQLLLILAVLVSSVVSLAGPIGFVGLIIPHVLKQLIPYVHKQFLTALALSGGVFLCLCDTLAQFVFFYTFPVGIITSFVGIPLFLFLLSKKHLQAQ
ncbi:MAG: iron ABC transporter permease [Cytophagaceae bacterium]|jgi:iron complex transport system permease protein|nr:iron ABC transporter permease [Cytophagaceae bacterium]